MDEFSLPERVRVEDAPVPAKKERWRLFAAYYVEEVLLGKEFGAGARSAVRAGYPKRSAPQRAYELLQKKHVREYIRDSIALARDAASVNNEEARGRADEASVGEVSWIISKLAWIVEEAPRAGQFAPAVSALGIMSKMHTIFRDGPVVDARSVNLVIPEGTTVDDLKRLRDDFILQKQLT